MNVFVSYRRSDTQDFAGRLADRLRATAGIDRVFIDVAEIEPGADFEAKIRESLADCEVCVLLIGPGWLGSRADGGAARVFDERDFVRLEAASALASGRKVLPILANDAQMPKRTELPDDLQRLTRINALSIRHASFERDLEYLVDTLLARRKAGNPVSYRNRHRVLAGFVSAIAGLLAAAALLLLGAALHDAIAERSLEQTLGGRGEVVMLVAVILFGGTIAGLLVRRRKR